MELVTVIARGYSIDADRWELEVTPRGDELSISVQVTTPDGRHPWGTGCAGPAQQRGRRLSTAWGHNDNGPSTLTARVTADVAAVVVTLSDGTREDLTLHGDVATLGIRIAVLVYPRRLDVHRVDLIAAGGTALSEKSS